VARFARKYGALLFDELAPLGGLVFPEPLIFGLLVLFGIEFEIEFEVEVEARVVVDVVVMVEVMVAAEEMEVVVMVDVTVDNEDKEEDEVLRCVPSIPPF